MDAPTISPKPDGPYLVKGLQALYNSRGETIPSPGGGSALCRCGGSANKPFCDGTHGRNGFVGARSPDAPPSRRKDYVGRSITVHDDRSMCAHSGVCTSGLASVFRMGQRPWIEPDCASAEAVAQTVRACPSGALSYSIGDAAAPAILREPAVTVTRNGPYAVVGSVALLNADFPAGASTEHYSLCRCGQSKNKPFCDGSHYNAGFSDERN
jgi:CDGSH-type Zn-finger protein/ferredoxin